MHFGSQAPSPLLLDLLAEPALSGTWQIFRCPALAESTLYSQCAANTNSVPGLQAKWASSPVVLHTKSLTVSLASHTRGKTFHRAGRTCFPHPPQSKDIRWNVCTKHTAGTSNTHTNCWMNHCGICVGLGRCSSKANCPSLDINPHNTSLLDHNITPVHEEHGLWLSRRAVWVGCCHERHL